MTLDPSSSHAAGSSFNGGTITRALGVTPAPGHASVPGLTITGATDQKRADDWDLLEVYSGDPTLLFSYESTGAPTFFLDAAQGAQFVIRALGGASVFKVLASGGVFTQPPNPGTVQLVSGVGTQPQQNYDVETYTPVTFNPGVATTATCTVAISPDDVTYSTLGVETVPVGVAFDGTIRLVKAHVPADWYLKLTVDAQAVLGLTTYY